MQSTLADTISNATTRMCNQGLQAALGLCELLALLARLVELAQHAGDAALELGLAQPEALLVLDAAFYIPLCIETRSTLIALPREVPERE